MIVLALKLGLFTLAAVAVLWICFLVCVAVVDVWSAE